MIFLYKIDNTEYLKKIFLENGSKTFLNMNRSKFNNTVFDYTDTYGYNWDATIELLVIKVIKT